mgnify:FL=1
MRRRVSRWLYWTPRIVSIAFIVFLALFSLDVITPEATPWQILGGLVMHNIPVFILIIVLVIAWKREYVGAFAFAFAGLLYLLLMLVSAIRNPLEWYALSYSVIIAGPAFGIAVLFYLNWKKKNR